MWGYIVMHRLMPGYMGYQYRAPGSSFLDCRESQMQGQMEHETEAGISVRTGFPGIIYPRAPV